MTVALGFAVVLGLAGCASAPLVLVCVNGHYVRDDGLVIPTHNCYQAVDGRVDDLEVPVPVKP